jgi:hypothetical protein
MYTDDAHTARGRRGGRIHFCGATVVLMLNASSCCRLRLCDARAERVRGAGVRCKETRAFARHLGISYIYDAKKENVSDLS